MTSKNQRLRAPALLATKQLLGGAVLAGALIGGCGGDAERDGGLGEVAIRSESLSGNPLTPVLTCMDDLGNQVYRAHFGYVNASSRSVHVPVGLLNFFVPSPRGQGQPRSFSPGEHLDELSVVFSSGDGWDHLAWWLAGRRALATQHTPLCQCPSVRRAPIVTTSCRARATSVRAGSAATARRPRARRAATPTCATALEPALRERSNVG